MIYQLSTEARLILRKLFVFKTFEADKHISERPVHYPVCRTDSKNIFVICITLQNPWIGNGKPSLDYFYFKYEIYNIVEKNQ